MLASSTPFGRLTDALAIPSAVVPLHRFSILYVSWRFPPQVSINAAKTAKIAPRRTHLRVEAVVSWEADEKSGTAEHDAALVLAIATDSDREAFAMLFGRFAGRVKGFLIKGGAAPDQAEELAQEVMITVWRRAASFDPTKASVATWIYTIARNRRIDQLRRFQRQEPDPNDPHFHPEPDPGAENQMAEATRDEMVRQAISDLTPDQRQVVELAFYAGLSHSEIAERLDAPLGTVKSRLRLSFNHLRGALGIGFSVELTED